MRKKNKRPIQIMFVDNDQHIRESLKVFFKNSDMSYLIFKSAAEGLNALKSQKIDIVISDYFLPDMDGVKFLKMVKKMNPTVKRILMATLTNNDLRQAIKKEKIEGFVEKPLTVSFLDKIIQGIISTEGD